MRLRNALLASAMTGISFAAPPIVAHAQSWAPITIKLQDPDPNDLARVNSAGRLRKTDEEESNEQGVVKFFADNTHGLYVEMRSGALSTGATPTDRVQAACVPFALVKNADGSVSMAKQPGEAFVTNNRGNEYRNANKPELVPINNGKNMLLMFNYQPNGTNDTRRYAKVLDQSCNIVPVTDAQGNSRTQVLVMAKNNDDCDMHQSGQGPCDISTDAGGTTHLTCWAGCNGNGRDDGWLNDLTVSCQNDAAGNATTCQIKKNFDVSLAQREERSRGRCSFADADPNTAICTWTEGNTQPQRDGVWVAAVDVSPNGQQGAEAQSRILWKQQIDGRHPNPLGNGRLYSVRMKSERVLNVKADGSLERTNQLILQWGELLGQNTNNRKGGRYQNLMMAVVQADKSGLSYVIPKTDVTDMMLGVDGTHLSMCPAVYGQGTSFIPGVSFLMGSQNGAGASASSSFTMGVDLVNKKFVSLGLHTLGGMYDRHLYSNYLGNNPGNQGRNFAGCTLVKNPFATTTQFFVAHALTGKDTQFVNNAALKQSSYVSLLPTNGAASSMPTSPAPSPNPSPNPGSNPGTTTGGMTGTGSGGSVGTTTDPTSQPAPQQAPQTSSSQAPSMWGCSVGTGSGSAGTVLLVVGLALVSIIRRKRA